MAFHKDDKSNWEKTTNSDTTLEYENKNNKFIVKIIIHFALKIVKIEASLRSNVSVETVADTLKKAGFHQAWDEYDDGYDKKIIINSGYLNSSQKLTQFLSVLRQLDNINSAEIINDIKTHSDSLFKIYDLDSPDEIKNALLKAAETCDKNSLTKLLEEARKPVRINQIKNSRGETLLMIAAAGNRKIPHGQSYETCSTLLKQGADPLATSNDGRTALMEAANFGRASVVTLLLDSVPSSERASYINRKDNAGTTAKEYAGQTGYFINEQEKISKILDESLEKEKLDASAKTVKSVNTKSPGQKSNN